jgi:hypothetical protein
MCASLLAIVATHYSSLFKVLLAIDQLLHIFFTLVHNCLGLLLVLNNISIAAGYYIIGGLLYNVADTLRKTIGTL